MGLLFSVAQLCPSLFNPMNCSTPGVSVPHHLLSLHKFMSIESLMPFIHLILYHRLLLLSSIFPNTRDFSNELAVCIGWPQYWSFSISPFIEYSRLISFRVYWFDLLAVQGTLKSPIWCWVGSDWSCMFSIQHTLIVSPCTHFPFWEPGLLDS